LPVSKMRMSSPTTRRGSQTSSYYRRSMKLTHIPSPTSWPMLTS
jgi:hypothetical protein